MDLTFAQKNEIKNNKERAFIFEVDNKKLVRITYPSERKYIFQVVGSSSLLSTQRSIPMVSNVTFCMDTVWDSIGDCGGKAGHISWVYNFTPDNNLASSSSMRSSG